MTSASSKSFLLKLLSGTEFNLKLADASDLIQAYKWLYDLELEVKKPLALSNQSPIVNVNKKAKKKPSKKKSGK